MEEKGGGRRRRKKRWGEEIERKTSGQKEEEIPIIKGHKQTKNNKTIRIKKSQNEKRP